MQVIAITHDIFNSWQTAQSHIDVTYQNPLTAYQTPVQFRQRDTESSLLFELFRVSRYN